MVLPCRRRPIRPPRGRISLPGFNVPLPGRSSVLLAYSRCLTTPPGRGSIFPDHSC
jgi:hypothetical protein